MKEEREHGKGKRTEIKRRAILEKHTIKNRKGRK